VEAFDGEQVVAAPEKAWLEAVFAIGQGQLDESSQFHDRGIER